jgi:hypothetical protein
MNSTMKAAPIIIVALALASSLPAIAQTTTADTQDVRIAEIVTQRETIIARNMPLTPDEREAFWPLYKKYRAERDEVDTRLTKLTSDLEKNRDNFTEDFARKLTTGLLDLQRADLSIKTKYLKPFQKVLSPAKVAKFYQMESKLDATLAYYRAQRVPNIR